MLPDNKGSSWSTDLGVAPEHCWALLKNKKAKWERQRGKTKREKEGEREEESGRREREREERGEKGRKREKSALL